VPPAMIFVPGLTAAAACTAESARWYVKLLMLPFPPLV
jgi:hypothetical protein